LGTFRQVTFEQGWTTLQQVNILQIAILLLINIGLVIGRWWLILYALGNDLPYLRLTRLRLGSCAVSYFTPVPQFGGKPIQVLFIRQFHGSSGEVSTSRVGLDKLFELIANSSLYLFGTTITLTIGWLPSKW